MNRHPYRLGFLCAILGIVARSLIEVGCPVTDDGIIDLHAQARTSVVATSETGRLWDYSHERWTFGTVSGVEVARSGFSLAGKVSADSRGIFQRSAALSWELPRGRVTYGLATSVYSFPGLPRDVYASGTLKVKLR